MDVCCCTQEEWRGEVIEVSWSPRAFLLKGFLKEAECEHLISKVCNTVWSDRQIGLLKSACIQCGDCSACVGLIYSTDCEATHMGPSPNENAILFSPNLIGRQAGNNSPDKTKCFGGVAGRSGISFVICSVQAKPSMVKSTVVDNDTGKSIDSTVRTSTGTFFGREVRDHPHMQPELFVLITQSYIGVYN